MSKFCEMTPQWPRMDVRKNSKFLNINIYSFEAHNLEISNM